MKKFLRRVSPKILLVSFFLTVLFSFFGFGAVCREIEGKVVRLHVLANSDGEEDQAVKLQIKDRVFSLAQSYLEQADSPEESVEILRAHVKEFEEAANQGLREAGCGYTARAEVTEQYFPTRAYDTFTLPAGMYSSLTVTLGKGEGHNWWCALYPALCVSSGAEFTGFTEEEEEIVTNPGEYRISFKLYEWYLALRNLFRGS